MKTLKPNATRDEVLCQVNAMLKTIQDWQLLNVYWFLHGMLYGYNPEDKSKGDQ